MTPEQRREAVLKRALPALFVLVIYFVFISGYISEKSNQAEKNYIAMIRKGLSDSALPGMEKQRQNLSAEIASLQAKDKDIQEKLLRDGVLSSHDSAIQAMDGISLLMERHRLRILVEKNLEKINDEQLTRSARDTRLWLKDILSEEEPAPKIIEVSFLGSYLDTYNALLALAKGDYKAIPVSLEMREPASDHAALPGQMEWVLKLWV
ncbi:MAG: hypothetical protein ACU833_10695 [Gammaproteobacteria bacterium]